MLKSKLMKLLKYSVTPSQTLTFIWPISMEKQKNTNKPKKIICVQSKSATLLIIWLENQYYNSVELEILKNIGEKPIKDPSLELISNDPFWLHFIVSPKL